ncbi:MAG: VacJ family lipoprotein [Thermodesulfobacteriota bacterium]|nr:VacJ family lipoprotein [Thermodesulfobacteriota bacterium]
MRPSFYKMIFCPCLVLLCLHLWPAGGSVLKGDFSFLSAHSVWAAENDIIDDDAYLDDDDYLDDDFDEETKISDPLEPLNRVFFQVNDKLYFWILKPVAQGYSFVVPKVMRGCIENAFNNLLAPIRVVNTLLQGRVRDSGREVSRFLINSTIGILGMADPAKDEFGLYPCKEDFGQTLATYGIGNGIYICWPILGPSTLRDTVGLIGDSFLDPIHYLYQSDTEAGLAVYAGREVNYTSLVIGDYEAFVEASFDPYLAMRDAYIQWREDLIKDRSGTAESSSRGSMLNETTF